MPYQNILLIFNKKSGKYPAILMKLCGKTSLILCYLPIFSLIAITFFIPAISLTIYTVFTCVTRDSTPAENRLVEKSAPRSAICCNRGPRDDPYAFFNGEMQEYVRT